MAGNVIGSQFIGPTPAQLQSAERDRVAELGQVFNATIQNLKKRQEEAFWKQLQQRALDDSSKTMTGYLKKDTQAAEKMFKYLGYSGKKLTAAMQALNTQDLNIEAMMNEEVSKVARMKGDGYEVKIPDEVIQRIFDPSTDQKAQGNGDLLPRQQPPQQSSGGNLFSDPSLFTDIKSGGMASAASYQGAVVPQASSPQQNFDYTLSGAEKNLATSQNLTDRIAGKNFTNTQSYATGGNPEAAARTLSTTGKGITTRVPNPAFDPSYGVGGKDRVIPSGAKPTELSQAKGSAGRYASSSQSGSAVLPPTTTAPATATIDTSARGRLEVAATQQLIPAVENYPDKEAVYADMKTIMAKTNGKIPRDLQTFEALRGQLRQEEAYAQQILANTKAKLTSPQQQREAEEVLTKPQIQADIISMAEQGIPTRDLDDYMDKKITMLDKANETNKVDVPFDQPKTMKEGLLKKAATWINEGIKDGKALREAAKTGKAPVDVKQYAKAVKNYITYNDVIAPQTPEQRDAMRADFNTWMQNPLVQQTLVINNPQAAPYLMKLWEQQVPLSDIDMKYINDTREAELKGTQTKNETERQRGLSYEAAADLNKARKDALIAQGGEKAQSAKLYSSIEANITKMIIANKFDMKKLRKIPEFVMLVNNHEAAGKPNGLLGGMKYWEEGGWFGTTKQMAEYMPGGTQNELVNVPPEGEEEPPYEDNPYLQNLGVVY